MALAMPTNFPLLRAVTKVCEFLKALSSISGLSAEDHLLAW